MSVLRGMVSTGAAGPVGEARQISVPWSAWRQGEGSVSGSSNLEMLFGVSAAWSCITLYADLLSTMPIHEFRRVNGDRVQVDSPAQILVRPSNVFTRREWVFSSVVALGAFGNAYGLVTDRDRSAVPSKVEWVEPSSVDVQQESALVRPTYKVAGRPTDRDDVVHLRRFPTVGAAVGAAPLDLHSELFEIAQATRRYAAEWFRGGAHPTGLLTTDEKIDPEAANEAKKRWKLSFARKHRDIAVLGNGWKYEAVQATPDAAMLSEAWNDIGGQVAQVFRVPPEMIGVGVSGSSVTYANRDQRVADFKAFSLEPWLNVFEDWWEQELPGNRFARFNLDKFLRSDPSTRHNIHEKTIRSGFATVNERRRIEDLPPVDGGDERLWPPYRSFPVEDDE